MSELETFGLPERFWHKVDRRGPDDCWLWTAARCRDGYGQYHVRGRNRATASRVACEAAHGPPSAGAQALHSCDNPSCCNPAHLRWGTVRDNVADAVSRGRWPRGETNGRAKLTDRKVRAILAFAAVFPQRFVAEAYGVSHMMVSAIVRGKNWKHVQRVLPIKARDETK